MDERYAAFQQKRRALISRSSSRTIWPLISLTVIPTAAFSINNPTYQVVTSSNVLTLTGTGPLAVENILINSNAYAVTWTSITNWRVSVPLSGGSNILNIVATDRNGNAISNATGGVTANYTGSTIAPEGFVVFNAIMAQPTAAHGEFVELFNAHTNYVRSLRLARERGGLYVPARRDSSAAQLPSAGGGWVRHNTAYGATDVAYDNFKGSLDGNGETLTLLRPAWHE